MCYYCLEYAVCCGGDVLSFILHSCRIFHVLTVRYEKPFARLEHAWPRNRHVVGDLVMFQKGVQETRTLFLPVARVANRRRARRYIRRSSRPALVRDNAYPRVVSSTRLTKDAGFLPPVRTRPLTSPLGFRASVNVFQAARKLLQRRGAAARRCSARNGRGA